MRRALFVCLAAASCIRDVPEPTAITPPQFLGPYSGVYASVIERPGVEAGTFVVQLGSRVLAMPYTVEGGAIAPSVFAVVLDVVSTEGDAADLGGRTDYVLPAKAFFGPGATCDGNATPPADLGEYLTMVTTCLLATCNFACMFANPFDFEGDRFQGTCTAPGICTVSDVDLFGRVDPSGLELFFTKLAITPPSRSIIECPPATATRPAADRCFRFGKQCQFDSRLAGVYRTELRGVGATRQLEIALAIADNYSAAVMFTGDAAYVGNFDPFRLTLHLTRLGLGAGEARTTVVPTTIEASLTERGDVVELSGTWSEEVGGASAVYEIAATRASGSAAGRACVPSTGCTSMPAVCPGGSAQPPGQQLLLGTRLTDTGCPFTDCQRLVDREALCPDAEIVCPAAPSAQVGTRTMQIAPVEVRMGCRDGSAACDVTGQCLSMRCTDVVTFENGTMTDLSCAQGDGPLLIGLDPNVGFRTVGCLPNAPYCSPFPPVCALDPVLGARTTYEPLLTEPCTQLGCWQNVTLPMLCDGSLPSCDASPAGEEAPVPAAVDRTGDGVPDCVEVTCERRAQLLEGAPCWAISQYQLGGGIDPDYGVDVTMAADCPIYRPHLP
jgi:hypothetical protein